MAFFYLTNKLQVTFYRKTNAEDKKNIVIEYFIDGFLKELDY